MFLSIQKSAVTSDHVIDDKSLFSLASYNIFSGFQTISDSKALRTQNAFSATLQKNLNSSRKYTSRKI